MLKKYEYSTIIGKVDLKVMGENGWRLINVSRNLRFQKEYLFMREKNIDLWDRGF